MTEQKLKLIRVEIPKTDAFMIAFPAPTKDLIDIAETKQDFMVGPEGQEVKARRLDYVRYSLNQMSDFICQLAYGQNAAWVKEHLMKKYPYLTEDSKVCFFLFKKITRIDADCADKDRDNKDLKDTKDSKD